MANSILVRTAYDPASAPSPSSQLPLIYIEGKEHLLIMSVYLPEAEQGAP